MAERTGPVAGEPKQRLSFGNSLSKAREGHEVEFFDAQLDFLAIDFLAIVRTPAHKRIFYIPRIEVIDIGFAEVAIMACPLRGSLSRY
ncbi:hypothetical protein MMC24_003508 [Lignoscripta atroalba]|nr:hypothetical protein [Lignoscripta atroalba]